MAHHFTERKLLNIIDAMKRVRAAGPLGLTQVWNTGTSRSVHNDLIDARNCGFVVRVEHRADSRRPRGWYLTRRGEDVLATVEMEGY